MNKEKKIEAEESMDEDFIPDEFDQDDDGEEPAYEAVEEKFEPRESISSRGGAGRRDQERFTGYNKPTTVVRKDGDSQANVNFGNFRSGEESFDPANRSSSVITEVVENKVVYLDSEKDLAEGNEMEKFERSDRKERDKQIQEYLDIDKNEYINKEEYEETLQEKEQEEEIRNIKNSEEWQSLERRRQTLLQEKQELEDLNDSILQNIEEVIPALEAANQATRSSFSKNDLNECKTFTNPPSNIVKVFQALMILLGRSTDWAKIKKFTSDPNCIKVIKELDIDNIPDENIEQLSDFIDDNNLTDIDSIKASSYAASNLAHYLVNVRQYCRINEEIKPKINQKKEVDLILAKKIVEIQKIEQAQNEMISKGIDGNNSDIRHAGLQTTFNGTKHIVHYEVEDDEGRLNIVNKEVLLDSNQLEEGNGVQGSNELGNYLQFQSNQNYGTNLNNEQNSLFFLSNLISKNDQSK